MPDSEETSSKADARSVYTLGASALSRERFSEILSGLRIRHVIDVRSSAEQQKRGSLKRNDAVYLSTSSKAEYHDASETLGGRPDYRLYALADEFAKHLDNIARLLQAGNVLILGVETDFR